MICEEMQAFTDSYGADLNTTLVGDLNRGLIGTGHL